ncbi:PAAR domain-containing protein [Pseudomonas cremoricolorata]|uniref:PAAR domain-containing protein n=1 Tax=Pseudomonas cremoricolorata TaxID=157783 RepID=UPI0009E00F7A|nr:PAAR domain-containing protein [Pseudomonas cremoricolorata]
MKPIVLVGHAHSCPILGVGTVETGDSATLVDGKPGARAGDRISCTVWDIEHYKPRLLSTLQVMELSIVQAKRHDLSPTIHAPLTSIIYHPPIAASALVELSILLPGFVLGTSQWFGGFDYSPELDKPGGVANPPNSYITDAGLALHFRHLSSNATQVRLTISYKPNHGIDEMDTLSQTFRLESI